MLPVQAFVDELVRSTSTSSLSSASAQPSNSASPPPSNTTAEVKVINNNVDAVGPKEYVFEYTCRGTGPNSVEYNYSIEGAGLDNLASLVQKFQGMIRNVIK